MTATQTGGVVLDEYQQDAVDEIRGCTSPAIALTGKAGSGKSEVVKHLLRNYRHEFTVCATTARAGLIVGGVTIDKLFCFNRDRWNVWNFDYLTYVMDNTPPNIIVDEASMVGSKMGGLVYELALKYGKRLVLVGDWAQACPVQDNWPFKTRLFKNLQILKLEGQHRQSDSAYLRALNYVREGCVDSSTVEYFKQHKGSPPDDHCVRMYATNDAVDQYNHERLNKHREKTGEMCFILYADMEDKRPDFKQDKSPLTEDQFDKMVDSASVADNDPFAIGARVIMTRNSEDGYVNGDTGDIVEAHIGGRAWTTMTDTEKNECMADGVFPDSIDVLMDRTGRVLRITPQDIEVKNPLNQVQYLVKGYTMKLGWAYTVHKSQGMTVDKAWIDLRMIAGFPERSRHGLAYVALSRTRTVDGLSFTGSVKKATYCDKAVKFIL